MKQQTLRKPSPILFDRRFLAGLFSLALPISLQQTLTAALHLVDVGMVGHLGDSELGTVGLVTKFFFITYHILIGLGSGAAVLSAQYIGQKNIEGSRRVLALSLSLSAAITLPFSLATWLYAQPIMQWLSQDAAVVEMGTAYLEITAPYHLLTGIVMAYSSLLRSVKMPKLPMVAGIGSIVLNTLLNYLLIFGWGPVPALGIEGAGYATVIARAWECIFILGLVYYYKLPIGLFSLQDFKKAFEWTFIRRLLKPTLPIIGGEYIWAMGIFAYYMIYSYMGTHELAAMSMLESLEGLFIQFFLGFGTACSILLGNELGAGRKATAYHKSQAFLLIIPFAGLIAGVLMVTCREPMLMAFPHLEASTKAMASNLFVLMGTALFIKIFNMLSMFGILRSGGDTRYMMMIDLVCMWGIGVPLAAAGALWLNLPLHWVYVLILGEEAIKAVWSYWRIQGRKWLNNLTEG